VNSIDRNAVIEAAALIAADQPPVWLIETMHTLGLMVIEARRAEAKQPTRKEARDRLKGVLAVANQMLSIIDPNMPDHDPATLRHLDGAADTPMQLDDLHILRDIVLELSGRAWRASEKIGGKGGTGKAWAHPETWSAKDICAGIVDEEWKRARTDELPSSSNSKLHEIAQSYWLATGGHTESAWGHKKSGWRKHFERARAGGVERATINSILDRPYLRPPDKSSLDTGRQNSLYSTDAD
jgi:hypothetical protein